MTNKNPKTCLLTVTNSCVLCCKMCDLWRLNTQEKEISITDCKKFIDSLSQFREDQFEVHIIGGESLIKKDIFELVKHISDKGWRSVITSCGYTIDESVARALVESGLSMLNLSLDSLVPEIHNFLRGREDCYQRLMKAIEYVSKYKGKNLKLGINAIISAKSLDGITGLAEWVMHNQNLDSIYFMAVMRPFGSSLSWDWFKKDDYAYLWPQDYAKTEAVLDELMHFKTKNSKIVNSIGQLQAFKKYFKDPFVFIKNNRCNVFQQAINVNALGDAYNCFFMDCLGNIKQDNIVELWNSEKAREVRNKMHACKQNCELVVNCYYEEN